ncbi:MAG: signal recognition particle-docking protein FtsY [Candidatus Diapherotrites archaeon]
MFDFLKKKISIFTEKVKQSIEQKAAASKAEEKKKEAKATSPKQKPEEKKKIAEIVSPPQAEEKIEIAHSISEPKAFEAEVFEESAPPEMEALEPEADEIEKTEPSRELKAKKSIGTQLKGLVLGETQLQEGDVRGFLDEFELALLESDVEQGTANAIVNSLRKQLVERKIKRGENLEKMLKTNVKNALLEVMNVPEIDFWKKMEGKKPFIILFLGPNGAGKTTTIAKVCSLLQKKGKKVILASADTFRAGSIEQIEIHAGRLKARVVKHQYGADPAAVAFDAVKAAEAEHADAVLIDTAGRQETNKNLMSELQKINRVVKPDLKIYIGESYMGQALLQQAKEFDQAIGVDGFILTKMDTDAKGGTAISLLYNLKKPILFVGVGQAYEDLETFDSAKIADKIVG